MINIASIATQVGSQNSLEIALQHNVQILSTSDGNTLLDIAND